MGRPVDRARPPPLCPGAPVPAAPLPAAPLPRPAAASSHPKPRAPRRLTLTLTLTLTRRYFGKYKKARDEEREAKAAASATGLEAGAEALSITNGGTGAWSKCPLGSAPARLLRLLRARQAALGSSALPGGEADPLNA